MIKYSKEGIVTQTLTEILEEREEALRPILGDDFVIDNSTPIGNMELADADRELAIQELIAWALPSQINANNAEGIFLDSICEKNRIERYQPEYTVVKLKIKGDVNATFYANDIVVYDKVSKVNYILDDTVNLDLDGVGYALFKCEYFGDYTPTNNSSFTVVDGTGIKVTMVPSTDTTNYSLKIGRFTETETELRIKRRNTIGQCATSSLESIQANLYAIDGITFVKAYENDSNINDAITNIDGTPQYNNTTVPSGSGLPIASFEFVIYAKSGLTESLKEQVGNALFYNKTLGAQAYSKNNTYIIKKDTYNNAFKLGYTEATKTPIYIKMIVDKDSQLTSSLEEKIKENIINIFNSNQGINKTLRAYSFYKTVSDLGDINYVASIKIGKSSTSINSDTLTSGLREIFTLDASNITITKATV